MPVQRLVAGSKGNPVNSKGSDLITTVNALIDITEESDLNIAQINLDNQYNPEKPENTNKFKKWRIAQSACKNGVRNARLLILGDSTFAGSGASNVAGYPPASNSRRLGPIHQLSSMFEGIGYNTYTDSCIGGQNAQAYYLWDTRFVAGTGWSTGATTSATLATTFTRPHYNNSTTNPLTFTPDKQIDTFVVHYAVRTAAGSFNWSLDGGSATNVSVQGAENAVGTFTASAGSVGSHALAITRVTGSIYILAIETYDSTKKGIDIIHMGGSGTNMSNIQALTNPWDALPFIKYLQPDLVVINLVINNWILAVNINTYRTQIQTAIDYFQANGIEVLFVTGLPTQVTWVGPNSVTIPLNTQLSYVDNLIDVCQDNGVVCLDSFRRFGTQEQAFLDGFYTDYTHPNFYGYHDFMKMIFNYISRI